MLLFVAVALLAIASNPRFTDGATTQLDFNYSADNDDVPEPCKNQLHCTEKPNDYPQEEVDNIFTKHQDKLVLEPAPSEELLRQKRFIAGDDDSELSGCQSHVTFNTIYKVRELSGPWRTVVQSPNVFEQRFRVETCINPGASCFSDLMTTRINAGCEQIFTTVELVVLKDSNETEKKMFRIPTSCRCSIKRTDAAIL